MDTMISLCQDKKINLSELKRPWTYKTLLEMPWQDGWAQTIFKNCWESTTGLVFFHMEAKFLT